MAGTPPGLDPGAAMTAPPHELYYIQTKRPEDRGAPFRSSPAIALSGGLGFQHLRAGSADRNLARLLGLGDLANEIDVQKTVFE